MKILLIVTMVVQATVYNALPNQTNEDNLHTASMQKINPDAAGSYRFIAVSRDLYSSGFTFGTRVCIENAGKMNGIWYVEDLMNRRWTKKIDFLVDNEIKLGKWDGVRIKIEE